MILRNSLRKGVFSRLEGLKRVSVLGAMAFLLGACSTVSLAPSGPQGGGEASDAGTGRLSDGQPGPARVHVGRVRERALNDDPFVGEERARAEVDRLIRSLEAREGDEDTEVRQAARAEGIAQDSIWTRIRAGFALPDLPTPLVSAKERFYLARPDYLDRMFTRASRYLFHIVEEIERRGIPTEIALLPFVESAMNPTALSHAQAAGLWQFIPSTGRAYDLKQNWWIDNRRDVVESTRAALDYLQMLHKLHGGDWFLALASYNWGEGSVKRAIRRNKAAGRDTDYLSLRMPRETRHYVPKLLALKRILMRADELGLKLPQVPNKPYFVVIEKTRPIDLELAAEFAGMSVDDFVALNPAHNRPVISASRNNRVKIPAENLDHFLAAIDEYAASGRPFVTWRPYTLKSGETIAKVASRTGIETQELLRINGLSSRRKIIAGTRLLVPDDRGAQPDQIADFDAPTVVEIVDRPERYYRVRSRDTLNGIARRFGVKTSDLKRWNGLTGNSIGVGRRLLVAQPTRQTVRTNGNGRRQVLEATALKTLVYQPSRYHRVQRGETLSGLADQYQVGLSELRRWNGLRRDTIFVGQRLQVARSTTRTLTRTVAHGGSESTVRVARGQTLGAIARQHGVSVADLRRWNGLSRDTIYVGQKLRVAQAPTSAPPATRAGAETVIRVRSGQTLGSIARQHGVSIADLRRWNGISGSVIKVGQRLRVQAPTQVVRSGGADDDSVKGTTRASDRRRGKVRTVKVARGDTLIALARRHRVSVDDLRRWNGLSRDTLFVGTQLRVSPPSRGTPVRHRVRRGDTLTEIARRYGVSIDHLRKVNGLRGDTIRFGQRLLIHDANAA